MASPAIVQTKTCVPEEMTPPLNVKLITTVADLALVEDFFKRNSVFCLDTETNVTPTFFDRRIRTIQVGNREEQYVIDLLPFAGYANLGELQGSFQSNPALQPVIDLIRPVLDSKNWLKVGHNLEFEYTVFKWCLGIDSFNFYDTLLAEKVIYSGAVNFFTHGFWALDDLVARRLGLHISKEYQTSFNLSDPLSPEQVTYAGLDVRLPLGLKASQYTDLTKGNLWTAARIEFDTIPASGDLHLNGIGFDTAKWLSLVEKNKQEKSRIVAEMDKHMIPVMGRKQAPTDDLEQLEHQWKQERDKEKRANYRKTYMTAQKAKTEWKKHGELYEGDAAINYGSSSQLREALWAYGIKKTALPDTSDQTLKQLAGEVMIDLIREYRKADKKIDTYGEEFITKYVNKYTQRIHQRFHQLGAATGRASSSDPNMQNLPRQQEYRDCFVARPGYKIITIDYNGCELRILAEYSQEPVWINAFKNGWDVHSLGASMLYGEKWKKHEHPECEWFKAKQKCSKKLCPEHAAMRDRVKAINFGLAYGMSAPRLAVELNIPLKEAEELLADYKKAFPTLVKYLENSGQRAAAKLEARTLAQRRRLFDRPDWNKAKAKAREKYGTEPNQKQIAKQYKAMYAAIEREGKNMPIQGSNADMIKLAMSAGFDFNGKPFLWHVLREYDAFLVNCVHDEICIEVREDQAETVLALAEDCMERAGAEFVKTIKMVAEGHIDLMWKK